MFPSACGDSCAALAGNEQYNSVFVDQVIAMEERAVTIGKPGFFNYIFPDNLGLNATDRARAAKAGLDETRILADLHVGYGGAIEQANSMFASNGVDYKGGAVNLETNAATHTMKRALAAGLGRGAVQLQRGLLELWRWVPGLAWR